MLCFISISITIKINYLIILSISLLHTLKAFASHGCVLILSQVCNILSSLLLSAILLGSSVYTECASLLNPYCDCSIGLLLNK